MSTTTAGWVVTTQAGDVHTYGTHTEGYGVQAADHYGSQGIAVGDVDGYATPADAAEAALNTGSDG